MSSAAGLAASLCGVCGRDTSSDGRCEDPSLWERCARLWESSVERARRMLRVNAILDDGPEISQTSLAFIKMDDREGKALIP